MTTEENQPRTFPRLYKSSRCYSVYSESVSTISSRDSSVSDPHILSSGEFYMEPPYCSTIKKIPPIHVDPIEISNTLCTFRYKHRLDNLRVWLLQPWGDVGSVGIQGLELERKADKKRIKPEVVSIIDSNGRTTSVKNSMEINALFSNHSSIEVVKCLFPNHRFNTLI